MRIDTRVGHIGDVDNRWLGRSAFTELVHELRGSGDAVALALGAPSLDDDDREAFRLCALALSSPDARVWPVKLCRILSSWGDPVAGYYGAQLVSAGSIMGPGTAPGCARGLEYVAAHAHEDGGVDAAVARWCALHDGRFSGFGVPFRPADERLVALVGFVEGTPLAERPFWRLRARIVDAMARQKGIAPNVVTGLVALLLDAGVPAANCGAAVAMLLSHVFLSHALEAAQTDGALRELPRDRVDYRGVPARRIGEAARRHEAVPAEGDTYSAQPSRG